MLRVPEIAPAVDVSLDVPPAWVEEVQRLKAEGKRATLPPKCLSNSGMRFRRKRSWLGWEKLQGRAGGYQLHEFFDRLEKSGRHP